MLRAAHPTKIQLKKKRKKEKGKNFSATLSILYEYSACSPVLRVADEVGKLRLKYFLLEILIFFIERSKHLLKGGALLNKILRCFWLKASYLKIFYVWGTLKHFI